MDELCDQQFVTGVDGFTGFVIDERPGWVPSLIKCLTCGSSLPLPTSADGLEALISFTKEQFGEDSPDVIPLGVIDSTVRG